MKSPKLKEILEERRIQIPENSWDKLAYRLAEQERKQQQRQRTAIYAASLVFIFVGLLYAYMQFEVVREEDGFVNQQAAPVMPTPFNQEDTSEENPSNRQGDRTDIVSVQIDTNASTVLEKGPEQLAVEPSLKLKDIPAISHARQDANNMDELEKMTSSKIEPIVQAKATVLASPELKDSLVAYLDREHLRASDAEIDQLLQEAQAAIKVLDGEEAMDPTAFPTAEALLNEVEYELDQSFKQRVFELVKRNIQRTRTAHVDR